MLLKDIQKQIKESLDVGKGVVDELVKHEDDDGKIDATEALQTMLSTFVNLIPIWVGMIGKLLKK